MVSVETAPAALAAPAGERARWTVVYTCRPYTANEYRRWHWTRRARADAEWRHAFGILTRQAHVPALTACRVEVAHYVTRRGNWPDVAACAPAAKAAIDGVVDAGVIADDDPAHLAGVTYRVAAMPDVWRRPGVTGALELTIIEAAP